MEELLQKHGCKPSPADKEKAKKLWRSKEKVVAWVEQCRKEQKKKKNGKGKGILCTIFGACLTCAQEEALKSETAKITGAADLTEATKFRAFETEVEVTKTALEAEQKMSAALSFHNGQLEVEKMLLKD